MNTHDCYLTVEYMYKRYLTHVEQYADACIVRQILRRTYDVRRTLYVVQHMFYLCTSYNIGSTYTNVQCTFTY